MRDITAWLLRETIGSSHTETATAHLGLLGRLLGLLGLSLLIFFVLTPLLDCNQVLIAGFVSHSLVFLPFLSGAAFPHRGQLLHHCGDLGIFAKLGLGSLTLILGEEQVGRHGTLGLRLVLLTARALGDITILLLFQVDGAELSVFLLGGLSKFHVRGTLGLAHAAPVGSNGRHHHSCLGILGELCADLRVLLLREKVVGRLGTLGLIWVLPFRGPARAGIRVRGMNERERGLVMVSSNWKSEAVFVRVLQRAELTKHSWP